MEQHEQCARFNLVGLRDAAECLRKGGQVARELRADAGICKEGALLQEFLFDGRYAAFGYTVFDNKWPIEVFDAAKQRPRQIIEDATAQCRNSNNGDDPLVDGGSDGPRAGDGAIPPVAYMYDLGNYVQIAIETVQMPCGVQFKNIDVSVGGDTLYVKPVVDESVPQTDCICSTMLDFKINADEAFRNATLLVFDYGWDHNPSNKMQIVKQRHVTPAN